MVQLDSTHYAPYYTKYVELVAEEDIVTAMRSQLGETVALLHGASEREACLHHHPYTWSIKDVVGHLTDSERVFAYRASGSRTAIRHRCPVLTRTPMFRQPSSTSNRSATWWRASRPSDDPASACFKAFRMRRGAGEASPTAMK